MPVSQASAASTAATPSARAAAVAFPDGWHARDGAISIL